MGICRLTLVATARTEENSGSTAQTAAEEVRAPSACTTLEERVNSSRRRKRLGVTVDKSCDLQPERQAFVMEQGDRDSGDPEQRRMHRAVWIARRVSPRGAAAGADKLMQPSHSPLSSA